MHCAGATRAGFFVVGAERREAERTAVPSRHSQGDPSGIGGDVVPLLARLPDQPIQCVVPLHDNATVEAGRRGLTSESRNFVTAQ